MLSVLLRSRETGAAPAAADCQPVPHVDLASRCRIHPHDSSPRSGLPRYEMPAARPPRRMPAGESWNSRHAAEQRSKTPNSPTDSAEEPIFFSGAHALRQNSIRPTCAYTSIASLSGGVGNLAWNPTANNFVTHFTTDSFLTTLQTLTLDGSLSGSLGSIGREIWGMAYRTADSTLYGWDYNAHDTGTINSSTGAWSQLNASPALHGKQSHGRPLLDHERPDVRCRQLQYRHSVWHFRLRRFVAVRYDCDKRQLCQYGSGQTTARRCMGFSGMALAPDAFTPSTQSRALLQTPWYPSLAPDWVLFFTVRSIVLSARALHVGPRSDRFGAARLPGSPQPEDVSSELIRTHRGVAIAPCHSQCHRVESRVSVRAAGPLLCDPARELGPTA